MFNSKEPIVYGQYYTLCLPLYLLCASKTAQRTLSCYRVKDHECLGSWAVNATQKWAALHRSRQWRQA